MWISCKLKNIIYIYLFIYLFRQQSAYLYAIPNTETLPKNISYTDSLLKTKCMITSREILNGNGQLNTDEGDFEKVSEFK